MYTKPVDSVFTRSDWLLELRMVSVIHHLAFCWIRTQVFPQFSENKGTIWCRLSTGLAYTKTIVHLSVGEEWSDICRAAKYLPLFTFTSVNNFQKRVGPEVMNNQ